MKFKKWFWGIFFLLAGVAVIINGLGFFQNINIFTLVITILLVPIMITSIPKLNFAGILFPLAIIAILFAEPLGITAITPIPVLITALFTSIGLSLLFHRNNHFHHEEHFDSIINEEDENVVNMKVSFGSSIKYVNSDNFEKGVFDCSFGAMKVYLDNAKLSKKGAEIIINASFCGIELYIPKEWKVINNVSTSIGGIEEKNKNSKTDGPTVTLVGKVSFSGVEIIYI